MSKGQGLATSVSSERIFSVVGNFFTQKRSRLKPLMVKCLVFLYQNKQDYIKYDKNLVYEKKVGFLIVD